MKPTNCFTEVGQRPYKMSQTHIYSALLYSIVKPSKPKSPWGQLLNCVQYIVKYSVYILCQIKQNIPYIVTYTKAAMNN